MRLWIVAGVLLGALPSFARSQTIEITPMAGYRFGGTRYSFAAIGGGAPKALSQGEARGGLILRWKWPAALSLVMSHDHTWLGAVARS